ncbi:MAG: AAA family ATPase [Streptosporangiaceae bacterium]|nr:AAA family ATPase [Streptosporangiaceae bacterium]
MSDAYGTLNTEMGRRMVSPVLVGRAEEMAALADAFATVRQGSPSTVLIGGEAGVGKSRLVAEFTASARADGARVLTGGCLELGADGLPFGPFTAMLRDLVRAEGAAAITGLLPGGGRATRELARLLPELAPEGGGNGAHPGEARARLFEELLTLLERLAATQPVILLIEDAHWADRSSRDLLSFLIGYQRALRNVLIVVTFRSDELHRTHPLRPLLAELARIEWIERMELRRLTRKEAEELATAILGREADKELTDALYRRAEGNPLFTEELLVCEDQESCEIPASLMDLLLQGVRRLPDETQEVLRIASAGSGGTGHALLAAVTGLSDEELTRALRPAVTANVLTTTEDGYTFRHALIREAVHEDLLPGEHGRAHSRFAEAIEAAPSLVPEGRADIEKAHQWYSAHNTTWALISAWQAAAQASRSVAPAERLVLLTRVLELWEQVPDAGERIGADHARVLEEAVAAASDAGEDQRGLAFASAAIREVDEAKEPVRVALLLERRQCFKINLGLPGVEEDLDRALRLVPEGVSREARTTVLLASAKCGDARGGPQFRAWAEEALRFAREAGDLASEAQALEIIAMVEADPGSLATPGSEPLRLIAGARALAQRAGAYQPMLRAAISESHLLCGAGEYERAAEVARQGIADAEKYGLARTSGAFLAINVAEPLLALGRWDEGIQVTERALDLAPPPLTRTWLWIVRSAIALGRGDIRTAARHAAAARAVLSGARYEAQYHLPLAWLDVELAMAEGGAAAAVAAAVGALDRFDLPTASPRYAWPVVAAAARAAAAAHVLVARGGSGGDGGDGGDRANGEEGTLRDAATALDDRLQTLAEKLDVFGPVQRAWELTYAATRLGSAAQAAPGERLAAWDAAAAAWESLRQPHQVAGALLGAARAALTTGTGAGAGTAAGGGATAGTGAAGGAGAAGGGGGAAEGDAAITPAQREAAAQRLRRAAPIASELGARPLAGAVAALARRAGISLTDDGAAAAAPGRLGLTDREFEVLRLVAAGQSNRDIAAELFISPKTASVHVSNILAKLGASSRGEAAARAHALHLFDDASGA